MKLAKKNKVAIQKAYDTLKRFDEYRSRLLKYVNAISGTSNATFAAKPPLFILTHFATKDSAQAIVRDFVLKVGNRGYISLSALSPIEYKAVTTSQRKFGFGFFLEDITDFDPYTPVAYFQNDGIAKEIRDGDSELAAKLLYEPTETQASISFVNLMEVRVKQSIPLERCAVFFRNEDLPDVAERLNKAGIFQIPFTSEWYRDHFLKSQSWYMRDDGDTIEFFDNRVCHYSTEMVLNTLEKLTGDT